MKFSNVLLFSIFTFLTLDIFVYLVNPYSLPVFPVSSNFLNNLNPISLANSYGITGFSIIPEWFIAYILYPILLIYYLISTLISIFIWIFNIIFLFNAYLPLVISSIIDFIFISLLFISFITSIRLAGSGIE